MDIEQKINEIVQELKNKLNIEQEIVIEYHNKIKAITDASHSEDKFILTLSKVWMKSFSDETVRLLVAERLINLYKANSNDNSSIKEIASKFDLNVNPDLDFEVEVTKARRKFSKYRATCRGCENVIYFQKMTKNWENDRYICSRCKSRFQISYN